MPTPLLPGERLDDLQCDGLKLIQRPDAFRFGTDSVLLADFAAPRKSDFKRPAPPSIRPSPGS